MRYPKSIEWTLDGLNLQIESGERLALVGSSGSGKSSIAKVLLHLLPKGSECEGHLLVAGKDPRKLNQSSLRLLRGHEVGLVFQDPMTRLNPLMTVGGHLVDTFQAHRPEKKFQWIREASEELLEKVGISAERFNHFPHQFSGGMRQRLVIALAMALKPSLLIADEPTTSLDVIVAKQIMKELNSLCQENNTSLLLITHDLALAANWCDRIAVLDGGKIIESNSTESLINHPVSKIAMRLVNAYQEKESIKKNSNLISTKSTLLEVRGIRCWYPLNDWPFDKRWIKAVDEVNFSLMERETLGIVGLSGCGKSTLCKALIGLTGVRGGEVLFQGENLLNLKGKAKRQARKLIQMVFQDPLASLNPKMTVLEALIDPLLIHSLVSRREAIRRTYSLLEQVGLHPPESFQSRFPRELSGGQQQRVAIARALAVSPKVLVCDESVSMLDSEIQLEVLSLLKSLQLQVGLGILFVTHDLVLASSFCDRIIVLDQGKIIEEGSSYKLLSKPKSILGVRLLEACPSLININSKN